MPFPIENTAWPPRQHADRYQRIEECAVWWGGDVNTLADFYGGSQGRTTPGLWVNEGGRLRRAVRAFSDEFWGAPEQAGASLNRYHVPAPAEIATKSSEGLFSEVPSFTVEPPRDADPESAEVEKMVAATQARLDDILDGIGFQNTLLAAAESGSALGSSTLRIGWDSNRMKHPTITAVDADATLQTVEWGEVRSVTLWRVVRADSATVWRHLELHEGGAIYHALYQGDGQNIGRMVPLTDDPATAGIAVNEFGASYAMTDATTAVSIPNMLPDPLDRQSALGRSDYTPATIGLMSALDKTFTSLMRDLDDGQSRLLVAEYMLGQGPLGTGRTFDLAQRLFTPLKRRPTEAGGDAPIDQVQFQIRVQDHLSMMDDLHKRAFHAAGFNVDEETGEVTMTATEYSGRNKRTLSTRDKKIGYWRPALERLLTSLLRIDAEVFPSGVTPLAVRVNFPEGIQATPRQLAEEASLMSSADASSRYTRIKHMHPDWSDQQVGEELERMAEDTSRSIIDPMTFGLGGAGVKPTDDASTPTPPAEEPGDAEGGTQGGS